MAYYALIPAAGNGVRMGRSLPKQYLTLSGYPVIWHALRALCGHPKISGVFVVIAPDDVRWPAQVMASLGDRLHVLRCGGRTRAESVLNGLHSMADLLGDIAEDWVLVHDAARPCLTKNLLEQLISEVGEDVVGGLLAVPVADTLKRVGSLSDGVARSSTTVPRDGLWQAQTPQMFRHELLLKALSRTNGMTDNSSSVTDEASAIETLGLAPRLVMSSTSNLKVTYPADLHLAEYLVNKYDSWEKA
jgi:2-C-methyl-D-erythritol 4-phosphate cytidylyltransferase